MSPPGLEGPSQIINKCLFNASFTRSKHLVNLIVLNVDVTIIHVLTVKQSKAFNSNRTTVTIAVQRALHLVHSRSVHANTIAMSVEASGPAAIAVQKLFLSSVDSQHCLLPIYMYVCMHARTHACTYARTNVFYMLCHKINGRMVPSELSIVLYPLDL